MRRLHLPSQLLARKSIDKLIRESEEPDKALKKSLGPWSLTALGIGAVIGSGIFTVIGTAMAGQHFDEPSIGATPLIHWIINHTAMAGRPGAGPALALSLVLVAIVCAFTGLCYAELSSMIPIAGSAYTYTYATLGELCAWIIGWDLILEYAFSNMSVSVGFAAHIVDLLDWFGIHMPLMWISPAYLPTGLQDLAGHDLYQPGWHFGFNVPAFLVVMVLTVILVRGIRESARANNIMVLVKIAAILVFVFAGASFIKPHYWHPFMPNGWTGVLTGGSIIFFTYIGMQQPSARHALRHPRHAYCMHGALQRSRHRAQRHCAMAIGHGGRRTGSERAQENVACAGRRGIALGAPFCSHRRTDGHGFLDSRLSAWPGTCVVRHVARRPAALHLQPHSRAVPHARLRHLGCRICGWHSRRNARYRNRVEPFKHWDAVRVCPGFDCGAHPALS
jgi:hypothetical protein